MNNPTGGGVLVCTTNGGALSRPASGGSERSSHRSRSRRSPRVTDSRAGTLGAQPAAGTRVYQLDATPRRYRRNQIDTSTYPGESIYRRSVVVGGEGGPDVSARSAGASGSPGLFNGHISARDHHNPYDEGQVEIWEGAALVKVVKQGRNEIKAEGEEQEKRTRGKITGFSRKSRQRMRTFLGKVRMASETLPLFATLTYPDEFPDQPSKFKRDLEIILQRLKRRFPGCAVVWRLEFKRRKSGVNAGRMAPHFHLLLWGIAEGFTPKAERGRFVKQTVDANGQWEYVVLDRAGSEVDHHMCGQCKPDNLGEWLSRNWYEVVGSGDVRHYRAGTNVKKLNDKHHVFAYVSKYLDKVQMDEGFPFPGRFWGVVNPHNVPLGNRVIIKCTGKQAAQVIRFQRRYLKAVTGRKLHRFNHWSFALLCEADFWLAMVRRYLAESGIECPF